MEAPITDEAGPVTATEHRPRFVVLDGFRGLAAICVAIYHCDLDFYHHGLFPHARLAVDFFFLLSGFVIPYSYSAKMRKGMSLTDYLRLRAERLYPLMILATCLGGAFALARPSLLVGGLASLSVAFPSAVLGLPNLWPGAQPFPLNGPGWSLFYELVASLAFGLMVKRTGWRGLVAIVLVSGALEIVASHQEDGLRAVAKQSQVLLGFTRVAFPFSLGAAIYYAHTCDRLPKWKMPVWAAAAVLVATFLPPFFYKASWLVDVLMVFPVYSLILMTGLHNDVPRWAVKPAEIAGALSYPLYIMHAPLLAIMTAIFAASPFWREHASASLLAAILAIAATTSVAAAYDNFARQTLKKHRPTASVRRSH